MLWWSLIDRQGSDSKKKKKNEADKGSVSNLAISAFVLSVEHLVIAQNNEFRGTTRR